MKYFPDINLSIRWKLLGAFLIAVLVPIIFLYAGASWRLTIICTFLSALLFAWYSGWRILGAVNGFRNIARRISVTPHQNLKKSPYKDELSDLLFTFDRFISSLEVLYVGKKEAASLRKPYSVSLQEGRRVFRASLSKSSYSFLNNINAAGMVPFIE